MKKEDLEKLGMSKEQVDKVLDMHHEEIDQVNDKLQKAEDDLKAANAAVETQKTTIGELKEELNKTEGVDVEKLIQKISDLETELTNQKKTHEDELADRDFNDLLKDSIASVKGKNAKAIMALLDVDTLKASNNQKEDVAAALKALTEAEDSKMLFGEPEANPVGTGNLIGQVPRSSSGTEDAVLRAAMGLPPATEQK